jgi:hypothetical protein
VPRSEWAALTMRGVRSMTTASLGPDRHLQYQVLPWKCLVRRFVHLEFPRVQGL